MEAPVDDPLVVEQIAAALHMNRVTVRDWLARGVIPGVKIGRRWYMTRENFDKLLAGQL